MKGVFLLAICFTFYVCASSQCSWYSPTEVSCEGQCLPFCESPFDATSLLGRVDGFIQNVRTRLSDFFSRWRAKRSVTEGPFVYRVLRRQERPENGLTAKDPSAQKTIQSHVGCGCRRNYRSQYISTTADLSAAEHYGGRSRIVEIDLSIARAAGCEVIDLSDGGDLRGTARNFAMASKEVLIVGHIPADAVTLIRPGSG